MKDKDFFIHLITKLGEIFNDVQTFGQLGLDISNSNIIVNYHQLLTIFLEEAYGEDGVATIRWFFLYNGCNYINYDELYDIVVLKKDIYKTY